MALPFSTRSDVPTPPPRLFPGASSLGRADRSRDARTDVRCHGRIRWLRGCRDRSLDIHSTMHWTKHSLNSALARCRHPSGSDLLASQIFGSVVFFSIYIGVRTNINRCLLPCLLSAWCCRRPQWDSARLSWQSSGTEEGRNRGVWPWVSAKRGH